MDSTTLADFVASHEGVIPYQYLDMRGNVTCGVGQLLGKAADLSRYRWSDFPTALSDFAMLRGMARDCAYGRTWPATRYKPLCRSRMVDPKEGLAETLAGISEALERRTTWYTKLTMGRQWACVDLAYQLGVDGVLKGFPHFTAAMERGDFEEASRQCHRPDASDGRNGACASMILTGRTA